MTNELPWPLSGASPKEVPLNNSPLVRVIAQVRFSPILSIRNPDMAAKFQEKIRLLYPILEQQQTHQVVFGTPNNPEVKTDVLWRFYDQDRKWAVSLTTEFIALEAMSYLSRKDFIERLGNILDPIEEIFSPAQATRIGLRYVDRIIEDDNIKDPQLLLKNESLGIIGTDLGPVSEHILSEALLPTEEGARIRTRWGKVPPNATMDPQTLEPISNPSWVLDFDMFTDDARDFSSKAISEETKKFSERIYSVFRWMVTEKFLKVYGGTP